LGHPCIYQRVSRLGSVTARQSSSERQPNFPALNRGRYLCSAGRQSRWALAHILVNICLYVVFVGWTLGAVLYENAKIQHDCEDADDDDDSDEDDEDDIHVLLSRLLIVGNDENIK